MGWVLKRRGWLLLAVGVGLAILLLYLNSRRPAALVSVARVERATIASSITTNGTVEPVEPHQLRAKFDGFVSRVSGVEGRAVRPGELLLTMDDRAVSARLNEARARLEALEDQWQAAKAGGRPDEAARLAAELWAAEAQRDLLQRQNEVLTRLVAENAATRDELERNRAELARASAEVERLSKAKEQFEHQVELDRSRLALLVAQTRDEIGHLEESVRSARVTAPVAGTLYALPVRAGDFVRTGDLLAAVADLSRIRVRVYVDEPELGRLQPGQEVEVSWEALPGRTWTGKIEVVPRQVVARGARNVGEVLCVVSNDPIELIPNTTVDVRIQLDERANVLTVPRGAVQIDGLRRYVYVLEGSRLRRREVEVGLSSATRFEVLSGLGEGDQVALPGETPLRDNMTVQVVEAP